MLTEAWKPPNPQGWPVGADSGRDEHVSCSPSEMRAGGGEGGGLRGTAASPRGTAEHCALSGAGTEWSILGHMRAGWFQELVNLNPPLD